MGAWSLFRGPGGELEAPGPAASRPQARSEARLDAPDTDTPRVAAQEPDPRAAEVSVVGEGGRTTDPQDELRLQGAVVVRDPHGLDHPRESGLLKLFLWRGNALESRQVEVDEGHYSTAVPRDVELGFPHLVLAGRPARVVDPPHRVALPEDGRLDLAARWAPDLLLRVVAADTGGDLDEVEVWTGFGWDRSRAPHPSRPEDGRRMVQGARSPVPLPLDSLDLAGAAQVVYARSPGYAWGRIELRLDRGGEQVLTLEPGGDLEVTILGELPGAGELLRARVGSARGGLAHAELALEGRGSLAVESLAQGPYTVSVELGEFWRDPLALARERVEVIAGERTPLVLTLSAGSVPEQAPLAGTVVLPAAWEKERCLLVVHLLDVPLSGQERIERLSLREATPLPNGDLAFPFDAGRVQPGLYELEVFEPPWPTTVRVPEEGLTYHRIAVPPPATCSLSITDAVTGADLEVRAVHWHPVWPEQVFGGAARPALLDPESGRWEFRAPQGAIELSLAGHEVRLEDPIVAIHPGHNALDLRARRRCSVQVILREGGADLEWRPEWRAVAHEVNGEGRSHGQGPLAPGVRLTVPHPGLYQIELSGLEGFRVDAPPAVDVPYGETAPYVVRLERE